MNPLLSDQTARAARRSLGDWLIHGCVYLFVIALLGVVGAAIMGSFEHDVRRWGWVAGALVAAIGYPLGYVTFPGFKVQKLTAAEQEAEERRPRQVLGPLKGSLVGVLLGVIVAIPIWFVVIILWLSLAMSPFTPDGWRDGLTTGLLVVYPSGMAALYSLICTMGACVAIGVALGLCGRMYKYGPADHP